MKRNRFGEPGIAILGTRTCPTCGTTFEVTSKQPDKVFCSISCGQIKPGTRVTKPCEHCGKEFTSERRKGRRFCSKACSVKQRWETTPELYAAVRVRSPANRRAASERMKRMNKDRDFRAKSDAARRGRPFAGTRGGNGHRTPQQMALAQAIGYKMEYAVATGNPSWPCALLDLANPELKIAVEVDGAMHNTALQKARDAVKEEMLAGLGWTVLRFTNREIDEDLNRVVAEILDCESRIHPFYRWN